MRVELPLIIPTENPAERRPEHGQEKALNQRLLPIQATSST
ncbi:MAG TPA: hypothetical protein PK836_01490 [Syntrophales bacterium]|nr:hypothetical protein [Syntrophales bacterium]